MADTTKQRLIDTGLFTEDRDLFGDCLVFGTGLQARLYFNSLGELTAVDIDTGDGGLC